MASWGGRSVERSNVFEGTNVEVFTPLPSLNSLSRQRAEKRLGTKLKFPGLSIPRRSSPTPFETSQDEGQNSPMKQSSNRSVFDDAPAAPPKKRGRPRIRTISPHGQYGRSNTSVNQYHDRSVFDDAPAAPPKKRGRPRTRPISPQGQYRRPTSSVNQYHDRSVFDDAPAAPPKKRGRPRTRPISPQGQYRRPTSSVNQYRDRSVFDDAPAAPPKKRGRPRTRPISPQGQYRRPTSSVNQYRDRSVFDDSPRAPGQRGRSQVRRSSPFRRSRSRSVFDNAPAGPVSSNHGKSVPRTMSPFRQSQGRFENEHSSSPSQQPVNLRSRTPVVGSDPEPSSAPQQSSFELETCPGNIFNAMTEEFDDNSPFPYVLDVPQFSNHDNLFSEFSKLFDYCNRSSQPMMRFYFQ